MGASRGSQVGERIQLLHLAGACDCQEAGHGDFAIFAAIVEHDLSPLHGGPQRAPRTLCQNNDVRSSPATVPGES